MPRSDGKFPSYTKLRIDPEVWPDNYWGSCRRCVKCSKRWPNTHLFQRCFDCMAKTVEAEGVPDMRWPEAVSIVLNARFEMLYSIWNEDVEDEELEWEDVKTNGEVDESKVKSVVDEFLSAKQQTRT